MLLFNFFFGGGCFILSCLYRLCVYCYSYTQASQRGSADLLPISSFLPGSLGAWRLVFLSQLLMFESLEHRIRLIPSQAQVQRLVLKEFLKVLFLLCLVLGLRVCATTP